MFYKYLLAILFATHCITAHGGVGSIDERKYVDWNSYPYNQIVYFFTREHGTCTAQYVAKDIILTARHCITEDTDFDNNKHIGELFTIKLSDGRQTQIKLEQYGHDFASDDWALLRVTDSNFYSNNTFTVSSQSKILTVTNAGFGYMRILKDDEIKKLKQIFKKNAKQHGLSKTNFMNLIVPSAQDTKANGIPLLMDWTDETIQCFKGDNPDDCDMEYKLKAHTDCKLTGIYADDKIISNTCDAMQGNSGGPYFANNTIYGIVSRGRDSFKDTRRGNVLAVAPSLIWKNMQNMLSANTNTVQTIQVTETPDISEQELQRREQDLTERAKNIDEQSDKEFFYFLSDATEYAVLQKQYERAKAREQSVGNRLLGALAIGAAGVGGQMLMQGRAEQNADAAAESDMRAYIETFRCDFGAGRNIRGGTEKIELPAANTLMQQKAEYINLAKRLQETKAALEMTPGIESELVLDAANSGLYDNESLGRTGGAYTSVSRALMDTDSTDAAEFAEQKSTAKKKATTGAIVGGVGVIGGAVGNLIINRDKDEGENQK